MNAWPDSIPPAHQRCKAAAAAGEARGHFQRFAVDLSQAFADVDQAKRDQDRQLSGMASAVTTDIVMPVSISNWGAYALEAGLAILAGRAELLHDADTERRMLVDCVAAGGVDGVTARQILAVDGTSAEVRRPQRAANRRASGSSNSRSPATNSATIAKQAAMTVVMSAEPWARSIR